MFISSPAALSLWNHLLASRSRRLQNPERASIDCPSPEIADRLKHRREQETESNREMRPSGLLFPFPLHTHILILVHFCLLVCSFILSTQLPVPTLQPTHPPNHPSIYSSIHPSIQSLTSESFSPINSFLKIISQFPSQLIQFL